MDLEFGSMLHNNRIILPVMIGKLAKMLIFDQIEKSWELSF